MPCLYLSLLSLPGSCFVAPVIVRSHGPALWAQHAWDRVCLGVWNGSPRHDAQDSPWCPVPPMDVLLGSLSQVPVPALLRTCPEALKNMHHPLHKSW